jgi:hypothetical protein
MAGRALADAQIEGPKGEAVNEVAHRAQGLFGLLKPAYDAAEHAVQFGRVGNDADQIRNLPFPTK